MNASLDGSSRRGEDEQQKNRIRRPSPLGGSRDAIVLAALASVALILRLARYPTPAAWVAGNGGYDPAVMYGAAAAMLAGHAAYRDFTFLHPPGVLLALAPFAALGAVIGDAAALSLATTAVAFLGVINTLLVAALLRRFGIASVVSGAGLYAVWSATAYTEQVVMLEPALNFVLLVALLALRGKRTLTTALAGIVMGIGVMTKLWAIVDVVVLSVMIGVITGLARVRWFITGVAIGGMALGLPFFLAAPAEMWRLIVATQIARPRDDVSLLERAAMFGPAPFLTHPVYQIPVLAFLLGAAGLCIWVSAQSFVSKRYDSEAGRWAIITLAHVLLLAFSASFYDHYSAWAAAPICLVLGYWIGQALLSLHRAWRRIAGVAVIACLAVLASAAFAGSLVRGLEAPTRDGQALSTWAEDHRCVWAGPVDLVAANAVSNNAANGCSSLIDPYGSRLADQQEGLTPEEARARVQDQTWRDMTQATGLVLPIEVERAGLPEDRRARLMERCHAVATSGQQALWDCG